MPTSLLLLVLAMLLCLGLSLATKGIGPLCYYCCYCCYFAAATTVVILVVVLTFDDYTVAEVGSTSL